jgi:hypothetical protein
MKRHGRHLAVVSCCLHPAFTIARLTGWRRSLKSLPSGHKPMLAPLAKFIDRSVLQIGYAMMIFNYE